jgi:hypothetical protein
VTFSKNREQGTDKIIILFIESRHDGNCTFLSTYCILCGYENSI